MRNSLHELFERIVFHDSPYETYIETIYDLPGKDRTTFQAYILEKINTGEFQDTAKNRMNIPVEIWHLELTHPHDENADRTALEIARSQWPEYIDGEVRKVVKHIESEFSHLPSSEIESIGPDRAKGSQQAVGTSKEFSYTEYAEALSLKGITIDKKGVGVRDGVNYVEKFGLKPGATLYNKTNDLTTGRKNHTEKLRAKAEEIIKKYNL